MDPAMDPYGPWEIGNETNNQKKGEMMMKRIGILSDTHGFIHPGVSDFFMHCDELWHAGDIGTIQAAKELSLLKPMKAVYGNIDDPGIRSVYDEYEVFTCENVKVLMIHIGGYPNKYTPQAKKLIEMHQPDLFISGHSHILKVMHDQKYNLLHINPGAAGNEGYHPVITMVRLSIDSNQIKDLEVFEGKRGQKNLSQSIR